MGAVPSRLDCCELDDPEARLICAESNDSVECLGGLGGSQCSNDDRGGCDWKQYQQHIANELMSEWRRVLSARCHIRVAASW